MTKEELIQKHEKVTIGLGHIYSAQISIEYAISVLEERKNNLDEAGEYNTPECGYLEDKIEELKALIN